MAEIDAPSDQPWWHATNAGNEAFARDDDDNAFRHYQRALFEADRLFRAAQHSYSACLFAPMAYNLSAYNLASWYWRWGETRHAKSLLRQAIDKLASHAETVDSPLALRVNCVRHLPRAAAYLSQFSSKPRTAPVERALQRRIERLYRQFSLLLANSSSSVDTDHTPSVH